MATDLCTAFTKVAVATWHRIEEAHSLSYWLGEETLTQLLIRDLLRLKLPGLRIRAYRKDEEGRNGADWEWWFRDSSGKVIGMRVQAKVIAEHTDSFEHLHYPHPKPRKGIAAHKFYQCDKLIAQAHANPKRPRIPIYCLYSYWTALPTGTSSRLGKAPLHLHASHFGCSVLAAEAVRRLRVKASKGPRVYHKCKLTDTLPHSVPLPYLVCWALANDNSLVEGILTLLRELGMVEAGIDYLTTLPDYVRFFLDSPAGQQLFPARQRDNLPGTDRPASGDPQEPSPADGIRQFVVFDQLRSG